MNPGILLVGRKHVKRVFGTLLFGLGVVFIVLAVGLPLYVAPAVTKLPYDLEPTSSLVVAKNVTFLDVDTGKATTPTGNLESLTEVVPQKKKTNNLQSQFQDNAVVWSVYTTTWRTDTKKVISKGSTELALERVSGAAVNWKDAWADDPSNKVNFSGQVYKFPFHTEKKDYPFWDPQLGNSNFPAKFQGVDTVKGVEVYRFEQTVPMTKLQAKPEQIAFLTSQFAPAGTTGGEMWYSNTRTFWVEPTTGQYLNLRERRNMELRWSGGMQTLLKGDFVYADSTVDKAVETAGSNKSLINTVRLYAPIGLGAGGLLFMIVGAVLARSPGVRRSRHAADSEYLD